ncbi:MAG TPA: prolyl oligopeptidase family serine peptidase [Vicinamibacteria bacterium]
MRLSDRSRAVCRILPFVLVGASATLVRADKPTYPPATQGAIVQDYGAVKVPDPYRWLENADDPETVRWVDAENALTRSYVDGPRREAIKARITELLDFPRVSVPEKQGARYFFTRNSGLQNQSVLYVREGLEGAERILLDPNALSSDGTVALVGASPTQDGALLGYSLSRSGSDRQEIYVRDVATGKDLPDKVLAKFTAIIWTPDKAGFYYTRFPQPGSVPAGDENYFAKVYFHRLGESQDKDALVFERPERKEVIWGANLTLDGRYLIVTGNEGSSDKSEVWIADRKGDGKPALLFKGFADAYAYVGDADGRLFFMTDKGAPMWRLVAVDVAHGGREAAPVLAEGKERLESASIVNKQIVVKRLRDASNRIFIHGLDGRELATIPLPALGTISSVTGEADDTEMFFDFTSFAYPLTPFRYDFKTGKTSEFAHVDAKVDASAYEVKQAWYPSGDGTKVPMFVVHKKGLPLDGRRPTVLYGYGGFNVNMTPSFSASRLYWLEQGSVYALANLRGGGEFGEAWHQAGMLEKKQNVFDDFIAAAEWLVKSGYTSRDRLAIQGGSNGGLLVGAALTQRPDLFGAVVCQVPVADMLRYHLFTVGRFWISEYGSADDPKQFSFLYKYSPYHNVKDGTAYPPTLVTTADTDDRVAPGLAKKFAARLQAATSGEAPILVRVETKAGHGGGKPVSKQIDELADIYAFLFRVLKVE